MPVRGHLARQRQPVYKLYSPPCLADVSSGLPNSDLKPLCHRDYSFAGGVLNTAMRKLGVDKY